MTEREAIAKEQLERATSSLAEAPFGDSEPSRLAESWRAFGEALAPLQAVPLDEGSLLEQVYRRRRLTVRRRVRWLLAAVLLIGLGAGLRPATLPVADLDPRQDPTPHQTATLTSVETPVDDARLSMVLWADELEEEFAEVEAEFERVERRWQTPPDAFANLRWRIEEWENQVAQSSL